MRFAILALVLVMATSAHGAETVLDCSAFRKGSDGVWKAIRTTTAAIVDTDRKTRHEFSIAEGTRFAPDRAGTHPAPDSPFDELLEEMSRRIDFVDELNKRCGSRIPPRSAR